MSANAQTVADLANWTPPQRARTGDDGEMVIEKLSPLPVAMAIDPSGGLMGIPLSNGISNRLQTDPYRMQILAEKQAKGWVLVGRCPLSSAEAIPHLPKSVRFAIGADGNPDESKPRSPCTQGVNGGRISGDSRPDRYNPCACIGLLLAARRARSNKKQEQNEERTNRLAKLAERTAQANLDATTQLADAAKALASAASSASSRGKDGK